MIGAGLQRAGDPAIGPAAFNVLQREAFAYFVKEVNPRNGLVADKTQPGAVARIAAVGLALSSYPVCVERGLMDRAEAVQRTLKTLQFFDGSMQSTEADATGYKGFYYHFLDMRSGRRAGDCEASTIDTAFLLAGMLTAAAYFLGNTGDEHEICQSARKRDPLSASKKDPSVHADRRRACALLERELWVSGPPERPSRVWRRRAAYPQRRQSQGGWGSWIRRGF